MAGSSSPGALRWLRSSTNYDDVAFYRDLVDLPVGGSFQESFGKEGTMFGLSDMTTTWRSCAPSAATPAQTGSSRSSSIRRRQRPCAALEPLLRAGFTPVAAPHPYWKANGGVMFLDPDGRASSTRPGSSAAGPIPSTTPRPTAIA